MDLRPYLQFNRRLSHQLTQLIAKTTLTPNHVTSLALVSGVMCGVFMSSGEHLGMIAGAIWLHLSFILDNCDGEVARLKSLQTGFGKWYDVIADLMVDQFLWLGLACGAVIGRQAYVVHVLAVALAACLGSILNATMVVWERRKGLSASVHIQPEPEPERKHSVFFSILDTLSHNGDSITLVWIVTLLGNHWGLLVAGAFFINFMWITRLAVNFRGLVVVSDSVDEESRQVS